MKTVTELIERRVGGPGTEEAKGKKAAEDKKADLKAFKVDIALSMLSNPDLGWNAVMTSTETTQNIEEILALLVKGDAKSLLKMARIIRQSALEHNKEIVDVAFYEAMKEFPTKPHQYE